MSRLIYQFNQYRLETQRMRRPPQNCRESPVTFVGVGLGVVSGRWHMIQEVACHGDGTVVHVYLFPIYCLVYPSMWPLVAEEYICFIRTHVWLCILEGFVEQC